MATKHNPFQLCFIITNFMVVALTLLVIMSSLGNQYDFQQAIPGLLKNDLQDIADSKTSPISPASWIHNFWAVIFIWHILWIIYSLVSLCRKSSDTEAPVYTSPVILPVALLLAFDVACLFNIAWFVVYDRSYTSTSTLVIFLAAISAWLSFIMSLHVMDLNRYPLEKAERGTEIKIIRFFIQNAMALYAMWCVLVFAFNLAVALIHNSTFNVSIDAATVTGMSVIAFTQVTFLLVDVICLDRFARYIVTPYIISIITLIACLYRQKDWMTDDVNFLFLCAMLAFAFLAIMTKSAFAAFREMKSTSESGEITRIGPNPYQLTPMHDSHYISAFESIP